ncbi:LOW QUALITY PROTEIN: cyclin-dependent kinase inhibitor 1 [Chanos chanos]|uniref:LOW QUALITY PROTEIN: cyclin-dependent kinase inhibitor 1 n=1 Tax=Chanos chanos TaxID=29144 RepID=A0A6J2VL81_CHACN|nr:LOW QUALITY PROTEIN: cyclin-dependent kinase inhibitor 1 [Chanos chanos]
MSSFKRILKSLGNGPTRRNLFGPVDREQFAARNTNNALQKDLEEASNRWGFDFVTEKPLEGGDFQWEGVPDVKVPALYRSCMVGDLPRVRGAESTSAAALVMEVSPGPSHNGKENIPCTLERYGDSHWGLEKTPEKRNKLKRKQTNITDFYQAKRRVVATPRKTGQ